MSSSDGTRENRGGMPPRFRSRDTAMVTRALTAALMLSIAVALIGSLRSEGAGMMTPRASPDASSVGSPSPRLWRHRSPHRLVDRCPWPSP